AAERALAAGAAQRAADIGDGVARTVALATDPSRHAWVARALAFAALHRGAAERMATAVIDLLGSARR
ncbi:MAG: 3-deoxy-D-manno-octulosonic acid transferase, partial [Rubrivivax sp.]|nr:3-deoxy-D-manno-octulosonic acid transferase [Rubrivivax sp.]